MVSVKTFLWLCFFVKILKGGKIDPKLHLNKTGILFNNTRRILSGQEAQNTQPYMVYLRADKKDPIYSYEPNWLCGGVIIDDHYILTSAACVEEVKNFYVISGTHSWSQDDNECISNGRKKAVWKCVPKEYYYDGNEFNNIRWMVNDIAVVKVEDDFNFEKRVIGCDFVPKKITYNNFSAELEKPGTIGSIAGWGSTDRFGDIISRHGGNSPELLEAEVVLISKKNCKKRWEKRYHKIIDDNMICSKGTFELTGPCTDKIECKDLIHEDDYEDDARRKNVEPKNAVVHGAGHRNVLNGRRLDKGIKSGAFCENDHGGPLVVGYGPKATVVGIITACLTKNVTNKCYGPFLYTSVYVNRDVINCAINKELVTTCRRVLRASKTRLNEVVLNWSI